MKKTIYEWGDTLRPTKKGVSSRIAKPEDYAYFIKYGSGETLRLLVCGKATIESHHQDFWEILPR